MADTEEKMIWVDMKVNDVYYGAVSLSDIRKNWGTENTNIQYDTMIGDGLTLNKANFGIFLKYNDDKFNDILSKDVKYKNECQKIIYYLTQIPIDMKQDFVNLFINGPVFTLIQYINNPNVADFSNTGFFRLRSIKSPCFFDCVSDIKNMLFLFMKCGVSPDYIIQVANRINNTHNYNKLKEILEKDVIKHAIDFKTKTEFETKQKEEQVNADHVYRDRYLSLLEKIQNMISEQRELVLQDKLIETRMRSHLNE